MASIQLVSPKNKPAYYKLIANVMVDGKRVHRYSRFEFDPTVLKTAAARRCAANAAAVEFERAEQTALQRQTCTGGRTFKEVALEYIEADRDHTDPLLRLTGDYAYKKNKYNTTYNKELYLRRLSELCELPRMEISKITKADCEKALQKLSSQGVRGGHHAYAVILSQSKRRKRTPCTAIAAACGMKKDTVERAFRGEHITPENAQKLATHFNQPVEKMFELHYDTRPLQVKTVREYAHFIRAVLEYAEDHYGLPNVAYNLKVKGGHRHGVDCLHEDQVEKLLAVLPGCALPDQALIYTLLNTGVRCSELAGLTWQDFNFTGCTVRVERSLQTYPDLGYQLSTTKTDNARDVDVAPEYMAFMQRYYEFWKARRMSMGDRWQNDMNKKRKKNAPSLRRLVGYDFVICDDVGFPVHTGGYSRTIDRVCALAGIPHTHPHMFRHTFVSMLLSNPDIGVATVAAEVGHSQPSTTLSIYTQVYGPHSMQIRSQMSRMLYGKQAAEAEEEETNIRRMGDVVVIKGQFKEG